MASKLEAARIATTAGENVIIAGGKQPGNLRRILAGEAVGTLFVAQGQTVASWKRWIGFTAQPRGISGCRCRCVRGDRIAGKSLLAIGWSMWMERFDKGDVVSIHDAAGAEFARGLSNYSAADVMRIKGLKTEQIAAALGQRPHDEMIHRDNMALTRKSRKQKSEGGRVTGMADSKTRMQTL